MEVIVPGETIDKDPKTGRFVPGNQLWKKADLRKVGRPNKFRTPRALWKKAKEYFEFVDNSTFHTQEHYVGANNSYVKEVRHFTPYTWQGLYVYLSVSSLDHYKKKPEFSGVIMLIDNIIYQQKVTGAAAGVFNPTIVSRLLGLKDQAEITQIVNDDNIDYSKLSDEALKEIVGARTNANR